MDISFTISALRQIGLTQTQIGDAIGVSQTSVSDMEAGKCGITRPTYKVISGLERLANTHNVSTEPVRKPVRRASAKVTPP